MFDQCSTCTGGETDWALFFQSREGETVCTLLSNSFVAHKSCNVFFSHAFCFRQAYKKRRRSERSQQGPTGACKGPTTKNQRKCGHAGQGTMSLRVQALFHHYPSHASRSPQVQRYREQLSRLYENAQRKSRWKKAVSSGDRYWSAHETCTCGIEVMHRVHLGIFRNRVQEEESHLGTCSSPSTSLMHRVLLLVSALLLTRQKGAIWS